LREQRLAGWILGDLKVFRAWYAGQLARLPAGTCPGVKKQNRDGSSQFYVFDARQMPEGFVVGRKSLIQDAAA
jgi:hypothetical protein